MEEKKESESNRCEKKSEQDQKKESSLKKEKVGVREKE